MMTNHPSVQTKEAPSVPVVELVGGPLCGDKVEWPSMVAWAQFPYRDGIALYVYEGKGKARYREG